MRTGEVRFGPFPGDLRGLLVEAGDTLVKQGWLLDRVQLEHLVLNAVMVTTSWDELIVDLKSCSAAVEELKGQFSRSR